MNNLTVVIATAGRHTLLERTLLSLAACSKPEAYQGSIVVENGARCGAEDVVARFERSLNARYLYFPEANKSAALNHALAECDADLIFFTDDDVRFDEGILVRYADAAAGTAEGKYFGGPVAPDYEVDPPAWRLRYLPASVRGWPLIGESSNEHPFLGFNWAAFASDIRRAGGFDLNRGPGSSSRSTGQESDMQKRLIAMGVEPSYVPHALVWHYIPPERCSLKWTLGRAYRTGIEKGMIHGDATLAGWASPLGFAAISILRAAGQILKYGAFLDRIGIWHAVYYGFRAVGIARGADLHAIAKRRSETPVTPKADQDINIIDT